MANTYKILGQSAPAATTETTLYTVPISTQAVVSTMAVCNQTSSPATYRIAVVPAADVGATAAKHYFVYGATVDALDTVTLTNGVTLGAGDVITVYASSANLSFHVYGSEVA